MSLSEKSKKSLQILEDIGQEDESAGIEATKFYMEEWAKKEENKQINTVEALKKVVGRPQRYKIMLAEILDRGAKELDYPMFYSLYANPSDEGIVLYMKDSTSIGRKPYTCAFRPTHSPKKDLTAIIYLLSKAQNTIDLLEYEKGQPLKSKSGIILES